MAEFDLEEIYYYTSLKWGEEQAERYSKFLKSEIEQAAESPGLDKSIGLRPGICFLICRWPKAKAGHWILYERTTEGVYVYRLLHSAMNRDSIIKYYADQ